MKSGFIAVFSIVVVLGSLLVTQPPEMKGFPQSKLRDGKRRS
jgi:hypothetical protein